MFHNWIGGVGSTRDSTNGLIVGEIKKNTRQQEDYEIPPDR